MRAPAASAIGAMHHRASTRAASTSSTRGGKPTRCSSATSTSRTASWVDRSARRARTTRRKTIVRDGAEFANDSGGYERYLSSDAAEGGEGDGEDGAAARAKEGAQMSTSSAQAGNVNVKLVPVTTTSSSRSCARARRLRRRRRGKGGTKGRRRREWLTISGRITYAGSRWRIRTP